MRLLYLLCFAFALLAISPVAADSEVDQDEARLLRNAGDILPLETILQQARSAHPGKVIEVELERKHGRLIYEMEILDEQGVVWEMKFDAGNGDILEEERDD